jgi:hypothetical protein
MPENDLDSYILSPSIAALSRVLSVSRLLSQALSTPDLGLFVILHFEVCPW